MPSLQFAFNNQADLAAALQGYHDAGIDPAWDNDMEELERQFAELRLLCSNN
jgi:hypothetical protein